MVSASPSKGSGFWRHPSHPGKRFPHLLCWLSCRLCLWRRQGILLLSSPPGPCAFLRVPCTPYMMPFLVTPSVESLSQGLWLCPVKPALSQEKMAPPGCFVPPAPDVSLSGQRPDAVSETFCLGSVVHRGCLRGYRLKALILQGL